MRPALGEGKASRVRPLIKEHFDRLPQVPLAELPEEARRSGWSEEEIEKLRAYLDFYGGNTAGGYARVVATGLAASDFPLFMTAASHCYLNDRYNEAYDLLRRFDAANAAEMERGEFLGLAGAIASAGGGGVAEAAAYFDQAIDEGLISWLLLVNAYPIYFEAGRHERVRELAEHIHDRYTDDPELIYALAWVHLARGYYPEGFRLAEVRYRLPNIARILSPALLSRPLWQGEPLTGKRLLIHGEQGLGDIIMMARYLPMFAGSGAEVLVDCREAAHTLLAYNFPDCEIISRETKKPITTEFDFWTGMASLPFHFKTTNDSVPARAGYLSIPAEQGDYWRGRVAGMVSGRAPRIGLAWSGNPNHRYDRRRSIPFGIIAPFIREKSDIDFFMLQTSSPGIHPQNLRNLSEEMLTLADTAALIGEMDLIITVDTSIVHIAGALGKATWLLLPQRYEWRWELEGEGNNWYDSVKVLRQPAHGDWEGLLNEVFGPRLKQFVESGQEQGRGNP